jgi:hypothetical protein
MRTKTLIALPVAAGLALGGASLATAEDPPNKPRRVVAPLERMPAPVFVRGGFMPEALGLDKTLGQELAKELGMEQEKVDAALRKVVESRLNAHRDRVLACFDDPARCAGLKRPEIALPEAMPAPFLVPPRPRRP